MNNPYNITVKVALTYPDGKTKSISNGASLTVPHGTAFKVSRTVPADYSGGAISEPSGSVNRKINIVVGDAKVIEYSKFVHDNSTVYFDLPWWVRVLKIKPDRRDAFYIPFFMNQAHRQTVRVELDNYKRMDITINNRGTAGDFVHNSGVDPYAGGSSMRNDNDSVTIYWSREINKVPESQWKGNVRMVRSGKSHDYYPDGWEFNG